MSNAECYRTAYDAKGSKKTSVEAASRLLADSKVRAMVESIYAKKERVILDRALSHREIVLDRLLKAVDDDSFGINRIRALDLLATVSGMKKHSLDVTQNDNRSSEAIAADLEAKLSALGLSDKDSTMDHRNVIDHGPVTYHSEVVDDGEIIEPDDAIDHDSTRH